MSHSNIAPLQGHIAFSDLPFGADIAQSSLQKSNCLPSKFAIAIPAHNEEERIISCLMACEATIIASRTSAQIVLLVNNSWDNTAPLAAAWAKQSQVQLVVAETVLPQAHAHAGGARALALALARGLIRPDGALMTTDADSHPSRNWASANLQLLRRGAALVCGRIELNVAEHAALPMQLTAKGRLDEAYFRASLELANVLDPDPFNPWPHHGSASGASLAISAHAYDRIGGAPTIAFGEDRALMHRVIQQDLPVIYSNEPHVVTSCRLDGRAHGGMADTIRFRLTQDDYICDEELEPPEKVLFRANLRALTRHLWKSGASLKGLLTSLGLDSIQEKPEAIYARFGALWAFIEKQSPQLTRQRLKHSDVTALLPRLLVYLEAVKQRQSTGAADRHERALVW